MARFQFFNFLVFASSTFVNHFTHETWNYIDELGFA